MAHIITGVDIGAHAVKFVLIDAGFRQSRVLQSFAVKVPEGEAPLAARQHQALQEGVSSLPGDANTIYAAIPGDKMAIRVLDLPFSDPRKIDQVVGYELEGQIVHALTDVVFDHAVVSAPDAGTSVLAVAVKSSDVGELIGAMKESHCEPRSLYAAPVVYQAMAADSGAALELGAPSCRIVMDIGHARTNLCFISGGGGGSGAPVTVFARTILRAGAALTGAIAQALGCPLGEAAAIKHQLGFLAASQHAPVDAGAQRMDAILREALAPLLREVRQTIAAFRAKSKMAVARVDLTGGSSPLAGLGAYLQDELEIPVGLLDPENDGAFSLAASIAWAGTRGGKQIDFRRGPFVYRASFSVVRQKALHLGILAAALVATATLDASMALGRLRTERDRLTAELRSATEDLFGAPRMDAKGVSSELKKSFRDDMAPLPKATAFDLLEAVSARMPSGDRIKLDILELDIRPKKTLIRGTIDSAAAVDEMVGKLKEIDCFEEITKGPITESGGAKNFSLTIASKCP